MEGWQWLKEGNFSKLGVANVSKWIRKNRKFGNWPSLQLQTREYTRQEYTFLWTKAYDFEKIAITKCGPFDYVTAKTCKGYFITTPHYQVLWIFG